MWVMEDRKYLWKEKGCKIILMFLYLGNDSSNFELWKLDDKLGFINLCFSSSLFFHRTFVQYFPCSPTTLFVNENFVEE